MEEGIRKRTLWTASHQGISFEVCHSTRPEYYYPEGSGVVERIGEKDNWTFYLYINLDCLPDSYDGPSFWLEPEHDAKGRPHYGYSDHPILAAIDWHYGITWYSKENGFEGGSKFIKAGCDYQHYWDEGRTYYVEGVIEDAKRAIDSFHELMPNVKRRCRWNGRYYPESEGTLVGESFTSHEGKRAWDESNRAAKATAASPAR